MNPTSVEKPTEKGQVPSVGSGDLLGVRPRTRFGHPITLRNGEDSALWAGDKIAVLRRSGNHALCVIEWNTYTSNPCRIEAWLPKRRLRFASPNTKDEPSARR